MGICDPQQMRCTRCNKTTWWNAITRPRDMIKDPAFGPYDLERRIVLLGWRCRSCGMESRSRGINVNPYWPTG